ncbi:MAG: DUF1826 domain-containing protein [Methylophilaceae bacterium]|nr:DUF1826 domain-containing protein [Methylophilaceae bacterium]
MQINPILSHSATKQVQTINASLLKMLDIFETDAQIVVIERAREHEIESYLQTAAHHMGEGFRVSLKAGEAFPQTLLPDLPGRAIFAGELEYLTQVYTDLLGCKAVGLRLEVISQAMCPRFHVDHTGIRLLCTYRGPGTEWLEDGYADRSKLGPASAGICDEESGIIQNVAGIYKVPLFAIALLKGSRWQGNTGLGIIHRSPQVPTETKPRVLLALDALW